MKPRHSKMPNPVSVEAPVTSNWHFGCIAASFAWGKSRGHSMASAEHGFINYGGSLKGIVLAAASARQRHSVAMKRRSNVACEGMLSNMSFERPVNNGGPRLARQGGRWSAAQLDR
ncbi:MAG: hypothetical protein IPP91_17085 [Betaproteobacteria bacterium]|nr:hypothetical protein [Betaproteobacteria bacterium]